MSPLTRLATCPECARGIAVRFNQTGAPVIRAHVSEPGHRCPTSNQEIDPRWVDVVHPWTVLRGGDDR